LFLTKQYELDFLNRITVLFNETGYRFHPLLFRMHAPFNLELWRRTKTLKWTDQSQSAPYLLPGDGQMGLLVTVESSDYTIGNVTWRVSSNGRASASQADGLPPLEDNANWCTLERTSQLERSWRYLLASNLSTQSIVTHLREARAPERRRTPLQPFVCAWANFATSVRANAINPPVFEPGILVRDTGRSTSVLGRSGDYSI
jgi:hypothetical protein